MMNVNEAVNLVVNKECTRQENDVLGCVATTTRLSRKRQKCAASKSWAGSELFFSLLKNNSPQ